MLGTHLNSTLMPQPDLTHFREYLDGEPIETLQAYMKKYDNNLNALRINFHQVKVSANAKIKQDIVSILESLNISKKGKFLENNPSIYDFFVLLARENHVQATAIINLIDEKTQLTRWDFFFRGGLILGGCLNLLRISEVRTAVQGLFSSTNCVPILGLTYTICSNLYSAYQIQFDEKKTLSNRLRENAFILATTTINIVAYSLVIGVFTTMPPLAASLFVFSSVMNIVKEALNLVLDQHRHVKSPFLDESNRLNEHKAFVRRQRGYEKRQHTLAMNYASSIVLTAIMACWCFIPGGLPLRIAALAAIAVVHIIKALLLNVYENKFNKELQEELRALPASYSEKDTNSSISSSRNPVTISTSSEEQISLPRNVKSSSNRPRSSLMNSCFSFFCCSPTSNEELFFEPITSLKQL